MDKAIKVKLNGKTYNTGTAKLVTSCSFLIDNYSSGYIINKHLYRKRTGEYFFVYESEIPWISPASKEEATDFMAYASSEVTNDREWIRHEKNSKS